MNMNKEYRRELLQLRRMQRKLWRELRAEMRACTKAQQQLTIRRAAARRNSNRAEAKIIRRIAVLEGRLS